MFCNPAESSSVIQQKQSSAIQQNRVLQSGRIKFCNPAESSSAIQQNQVLQSSRIGFCNPAGSGFAIQQNLILQSGRIGFCKSSRIGFCNPAESGFAIRQNRVLQSGKIGFCNPAKSGAIGYLINIVPIEMFTIFALHVYDINRFLHYQFTHEVPPIIVIGTVKYIISIIISSNIHSLLHISYLKINYVTY